MPPKHAPPEDHSPKIPNTARHFLPQPNSPNPPDSSPPEPAPSSTWACTTCDKAMKFVHRASHLLSNSHIRTARSRTPFTDLPLQQSTWRCVECGDCMPLSHRIGHLANKHDTPNTLPTQSPASAFADISRTANQLYELSTSNIFPSHTAQLDQGQREHLGEENDRCVYCSHIALHGHQCGIMQCELCGVWLSRRYEFVHQFTARHRHAVAQVTWEREQQEVLGRVPEDCPSPAVEGGDSTNDNPLEMATRDIDLAMETEYIPSRGLGGCPHCIALVQGGRYHHLECEAVNHCSRCGCATCYAQSSKSDPTGDTTWTDEKRWTCTLCSRTMRIGSREGHEALATHRARVQPRLRQVHGRGKPLPRKKSKPGNEKWQCEVCERTLRVNERDNHLASRKHQRKEGLAQLPDKTKGKQPQRKRQPGGGLVLRIIPATNRFQMPYNRNDKYEAHSTMPEGQWHCALCSRTMLRGSRNHHCLGRSHRSNYRAMKIAEIIPGYRRRTGAPSGGRPTHVEGPSYCDCGKRVLGGIWCKVCDFRPDFMRGKKGGRSQFSRPRE